MGMEYFFHNEGGETVKQLSEKHLFFIMVPLGIVAIKTYSSLFVRIIGHDTYIVVALAVLIFTAISTYSIWILKRNKNYNIFQVYTVALGKRSGSLFYFFLLCTIFVNLIECAGVISNLLHINVILETPIWYILIFIVFTGTFAANQKTSTTIAVVTINVILISFAGIQLSMLVSPYKRFERLLPILADGFTMRHFQGLILCLGGVGSIVIAYFYLQDIVKTKNIIRYAFLSLVFVSQLLIVSISGHTAVFITERFQNIWYPAIIEAQLISQFKFAEAGELYIMLQSVNGWSIKFIICYHCFLRLIGMDYAKPFNPKIYGLSVLLLLITYGVANKVAVLFQFLHVYLYLSFVNFVILPPIIYTIFHLRNGKNRS